MQISPDFQRWCQTVFSVFRRLHSTNTLHLRIYTKEALVCYGQPSFCLWCVLMFQTTQKISNLLLKQVYCMADSQTKWILQSSKWLCGVWQGCCDEPTENYYQHSSAAPLGSTFWPLKYIYGFRSLQSTLIHLIFSNRRQVTCWD